MPSAATDERDGRLRVVELGVHELAGTTTRGSTHSANFSTWMAAALRKPARIANTDEDDERHRDHRRRLVRVPVAAVLAEEREVHAAGHVGRGEERADEADDEEDVVARLARR